MERLKRKIAGLRAKTMDVNREMGTPDDDPEVRAFLLGLEACEGLIAEREAETCDCCEFWSEHLSGGSGDCRQTPITGAEQTWCHETCEHWTHKGDQ